MSIMKLKLFFISNYINLYYFYYFITLFSFWK